MLKVVFTVVLTLKNGSTVVAREQGYEPTFSEIEGDIIQQNENTFRVHDTVKYARVEKGFKLVKEEK